MLAVRRIWNASYNVYLGNILDNLSIQVRWPPRGLGCNLSNLERTLKKKSYSPKWLITHLQVYLIFQMSQLFAHLPPVRVSLYPYTSPGRSRNKLQRFKQINNTFLCMYSLIQYMTKDSWYLYDIAHQKKKKQKNEMKWEIFVFNIAYYWYV